MNSYINIIHSISYTLVIQIEFTIVGVFFFVLSLIVPFYTFE